MKPMDYKMKTLLYISLFLSINLIAQNSGLNKKVDSLMLVMKSYSNEIENLEKNELIEYVLTRAYKNRGYVKIELEDYRGAISDFNQASKVNIGNWRIWEEVLFGRAYCKDKIGDYEGAIKEYEKVFIHNPKNINAHINIGLLKIQTGRKNEGCLNISKAGELGDKDAYRLISEYCK